MTGANEKQGLCRRRLQVKKKWLHTDGNKLQMRGHNEDLNRPLCVCVRGKTEHASAQIRTELVIPISLRLVVYWYHWFKTAAAWYSHVILDCIEPGAHWEGLQAMIMQQQDLISCPLDLSSPSVISTRTLSTFILQPEYLHRFSQSSTHMRLSIFHHLLENSDLI